MAAADAWLGVSLPPVSDRKAGGGAHEPRQVSAAEPAGFLSEVGVIHRRGHKPRVPGLTGVYREDLPTPAASGTFTRRDATLPAFLGGR